MLVSCVHHDLRQIGGETEVFLVLVDHGMAVGMDQALRLGPVREWLGGVGVFNCIFFRHDSKDWGWVVLKGLVQ